MNCTKIEMKLRPQPGGKCATRVFAWYGMDIAATLEMAENEGPCIAQALFHKRLEQMVEFVNALGGSITIDDVDADMTVERA